MSRLFMHIFLVEKGEGDSLGIVFHLQGFFSSMESKKIYDFKEISVLTWKSIEDDHQDMQFLGEMSCTMIV